VRILLLPFSLSYNTTTGPLPGPGVGAGSLPSNRQGFSVPETTVAPQFHQPLNVHGDFRAKLSFNLIVVINDFADGRDLVFSQLIRLGSKVYTGLLQYLPRCAAPNPINIGQTNLSPLVFRQINSCNPCQSCASRQFSSFVACCWILDSGLFLSLSFKSKIRNRISPAFAYVSYSRK
jgi:hypothetical protein